MAGGPAPNHQSGLGEDAVLSHPVQTSQREPLAPDSYLTQRYLLPCVGRRSELLQLYRALEDALDGHGSAWAITGPPGIGKTRVLEELGTIAVRRGFTVRKGYGVRDVSIPLYPLLQVFDPGTVGALSHTPGVKLGAGTRFDSRPPVHPRFRRRTVRPSGSPAVASLRRPAFRGQPHDGSSVDRTLLEMIRALEGETTPQLLILDDFESADQESTRGLNLLARSVASSPVVVVAALRDESPKQGDGVRRFMTQTETSQRAGLLRTLRLRPLNENEGLEVLQSYLGQGSKTTLYNASAHDLIERSGGNPYFLLELVDAGLRSGQITRRRGHWFVRSRSSTTVTGPDPQRDVPPSVRRLIANRLAGLDIADQRLIRIAARLGVCFESSPLAVSTGFDDRQVILRLHRLAEDGWPIRWVDRESEVFEFDHALVRETLNDRLAFPVDSQSLERLAIWWRVHREDDPLTEGALWAEMGKFDELVVAVRRAIRRATADRAYRQVPHLLHWLLFHLPPEERTAERIGPVVLSAAQGLRTEIEPDRVVEALAELEGQRLPLEVEIPTRLWRIEAAIFRTSPGQCHRLLEEYESELRTRLGRVPPQYQWRMAYVRALLAAQNEPPQKAVQTVRKAFASLPDHDCAHETVQLYRSWVGALHHLGRRGQARAVIRRARRWAKSHGLTGNMAALEFGETEMRHAFVEGNWAKGLRYARRQIDRCRAGGNVTAEFRALLGMASLEYSCREMAAAREHLSQALGIADRLDLPSMAGLANILAGWIAIYDEEYRRAGEALGAFEQSSTTGSDSIYRTWARVGSAIVQAECGDCQGALRELDELRRTLGANRLSLAYEFHCAEARVFELLGDFDKSRAALNAGWRAARLRGGVADRAGVAAELTEWARRHGSVALHRRWRERYQALCRAASLDSDRDWKGIAFPPSSRSSPVPTAIVPMAHTAMQRHFPGAVSFRDLILKFLRDWSTDRAPQRSSVRHDRRATESDIAQGLGVPRDRFARALQRLLNEGWIERTRCRIEGQARSVYAYGLTPVHNTIAISAGSHPFTIDPI